MSDNTQALTPELGALVEDTERMFNEGVATGIRYDYAGADLAIVVAAWSRIPHLIAGIRALESQIGQWEQRYITEVGRLGKQVRELESRAADLGTLADNQEHALTRQQQRIEELELQLAASRNHTELAEAVIVSKQERIERLEAVRGAMEAWIERKKQCGFCGRVIRETYPLKHAQDCPLAANTPPQPPTVGSGEWKYTAEVVTQEGPGEGGENG